MSVPAQYPDQPVRVSHYNALGTIPCPICKALYAPDQSHEYLTHASSMALESAFMSMCHFCFRCRRPACPECWDDIHGVCAVCVHDAGLPFRARSLPLEGSLFPSLHQEQIKQRDVAQSPLVCVRSGFLPDPISSSPSGSLDIDEIVTQPPGYNRRSVPHVAVEKHVTIPAVSPVVAPTTPRLLDIDEIVTQPPPGNSLSASSTRVSRPAARPWVRFLRALFGFLFGLLLLVILVLVLATISMDVNVFLLKTLGVDIRATLIYLWQLLQHLH